MADPAGFPRPISPRERNSHLFGRAVTSSETWTWLHSPSFRATPLDVKVEADRHFLQGINQLIGHGRPYTPDGLPDPGRRAGAVKCPPYSVEVTGLLQPGENRIRIDVANTAMNQMAGRALPDYRLLNLRYGVRFKPQDMDKVKPVPSGLIGPIRLVAKE